MVGKHTISMLYYLCERKDMSMSNYHPLLDFPSITLARQILASIKREPCLRSMAKIWSAYGLAELANLWWKIIQTTMLDIIVNSSSSANITGQVTIDRPRRRAFLDQPPTSAATRPPAPVSFFQFTLQLPRRSQHKFASAPSCSCSCSCRPRPAAPLSLLLAFATASAAPLLWEKKKTFSSASAPGCKAPLRSLPPPRADPDRRPPALYPPHLATSPRGSALRLASAMAEPKREQRPLLEVRYPFFVQSKACVGPPIPAPCTDHFEFEGGDERRLGQRIGAPHFRCSR